MTGGRIRIRMEAYDHLALDASAKEIVDTWKKSKRIPDAYASVVLSAVNYSGSANGTLVARVLGLTAPLIPPKIQLSKAGEMAAPAAKK